jgi:hypothetical protein
MIFSNREKPDRCEGCDQPWDVDEESGDEAVADECNLCGAIICEDCYEVCFNECICFDCGEQMIHDFKLTQERKRKRNGPQQQ